MAAEGTGPRVPLRAIDLMASLAPVLLIVALISTYFISPRFYLSSVLSGRNREYQAVEQMTFACAFVASLLLFVAAWRLWRRNESVSSGFANLAERRSGAILVTLVALATFFFAGEEISWGQSYLQWATPASIRNTAPETNLHNIHGLPVSVNSLGSVFLILVFFVLPIAWRRRNMPRSWHPGIAEWPVVFSMAVAFLWKAFKTCYVLCVADATSRTFYVEFVDQLNEHKEMLVAVSLLMYGLYRLPATRDDAARSRDAGTTKIVTDDLAAAA